ncbi:hypothetical protein [Yinghuangia sp. YIM S09857]|uniref:hypothetical protein n=1 Tax=Yinghuangia sp. YIM S09857 TaxID=3436929 RepID=UPI003F53C6C4
MGGKGQFEDKWAYDPKAASLKPDSVPTEESDGPIRPLTGGLYIDDDPTAEPDKDIFYGYLRFTPPDRVTSVTSSGNPEQVARWLGPEHRFSSHGTYELFGAAISFAATSKSGTVLYQGVIGPGALTLALDSRSLINGHRAHRTYHFEPIDFPD